MAAVAFKRSPTLIEVGTLSLTDIDVIGPATNDLHRVIVTARLIAVADDLDKLIASLHVSAIALDSLIGMFGGHKLTGDAVSHILDRLRTGILSLVGLRHRAIDPLRARVTGIGLKADIPVATVSQ